MLKFAPKRQKPLQKPVAQLGKAQIGPKPYAYAEIVTTAQICTQNHYKNQKHSQENIEFKLKLVLIGKNIKSKILGVLKMHVLGF